MRKMNWIKTEDRMPKCHGIDDSDEVIIYGPRIGIISGVRYSYSNEVFVDQMDTTFEEKEVSHWMPLPEPPEAQHE